MSTPVSETRTRLMGQHAEARRRREAAPLESDEYRAACEDVARIEVAIAAAEEPGQAGAVTADVPSAATLGGPAASVPAAWETKTA